MTVFKTPEKERKTALAYRIKHRQLIRAKAKKVYKEKCQNRTDQIVREHALRARSGPFTKPDLIPEALKKYDCSYGFLASDYDFNLFNSLEIEFLDLQ